MINLEIKKNALLWLKKIEEQIRGIQKMMEKEEYCIDIINQVITDQIALN